MANRHLSPDGHGGPNVSEAMTRTGRSRLERRPRMAKCPCSQGWREGTIAKEGKMP